MEEEIQEKLQEKYTFPINVKFKDFRMYDLEFKIEKQNFVIPIIYDAKFTLESNVTNCEMKIDREILNLYKRGEEYV